MTSGLTLFVVGILVAAGAGAVLAPRLPGPLRARVRPTPTPLAPLPVRLGRRLRTHRPRLAQGASRALGKSARSDEVDALLALRAGAAIVGALLTLPLGGFGVMAMAPAALAGRWAITRAFLTRRSRLAARLAGAVADAVDLLAVAAGAGLNVFRSLEVVAATTGPQIRPELQRVVDGVRCGRPLRDGLADFARRVPLDDVATLARAIGSAHQKGVPLVAAVERAADELRTSRRQAAEAAARTAPVKMLFPLAFLVLPSFLLLAAAPLLVVAFRQVGR